MRDVVRRVVLPLVSLLVAAILAVPAQSAPTWVSPSVPLSLSGDASRQQVAMNAAGDVVAVWQSSFELGSKIVVQASVHPVGGSWSPPVDLSSSTGVAQFPQVAIDAAGNATAVWELDGPIPVVQASSRPAGGSWTTPVPLSDVTGGAHLPKVAVDDAGNAVAIWNADLSVQWASRPAGGSWSEADQFTSTLSSNLVESALTITPGGVATAAWTDIQGGKEVVMVTDRQPGGGWTTPDDVSDSTADASGVDLASSTSGAAVLTWVWTGPDVTTPDTNDVALVIQARARDSALGAWGSVSNLSPVGGDADVPEAAVDDLGRMTVVWSAPAGGHHVIRAARRGTDLTWSGGLDLSASNVDGVVPDIAAARSGDVFATWRDENTSKLQAARRPVGNVGWLAPDDLTDGSTGPIDPHLGMDAAGNAVVVWQDADHVRARVFDNTGPVVATLTVPAKAQAEKAVTMSVNAKDVWSPFSVVWTFGDGKQASGTTVKHTYAKSGLYKVFMTATDAVGNVTTRGATIFAGPPLPRVSAVQLTKTAIHVVGSAKLPRATRLKLTLNTKALVIVKLKRTTRFHGQKVVASLTDKRAAGRQSFRLTSRIGSKRLPPGVYRVTVTARNGVGTSKPKVVRLTITP